MTFYLIYNYFWQAFLTLKWLEQGNFLQTKPVLRFGLIFNASIQDKILQVHHR